MTLFEQGTVLLRNGEIAGTFDGVLGASETAEQVELRVGSGRHSFTVTHG